jgi:aldehyde dehydrogenase (NAD+)
VGERNVLFIGGEWRKPASDDVIEVVSPSTEEVAGTAPAAGAADVDAAVQAARSALEGGQWRETSVDERVAVIERALQLLEPKSAEIAELVTTEMGAPISVTEQLVPGALWAARYFAGVAQSEPLVELRPGVNTAAVLREPVGVVASIAPWNGPFNLAMAKIVPPLLAGCSVVFKPAPETPLDVYYLVDALAEAGLPAGVLNLVTGGRETGEALVAHPGVDKVSFTGSTAAGRQIGAVCGESFKRMQLELGGKSAAIILDDADIQTTMAGLAMGSFFNSGQICAAYSRVLAPRSRYSEVVDALCATAESFVLGDPFDRATTMGPLVAKRQRDRVEGYIAAGQEEGAKIATGGNRPAHLDRGWYVEPTVFVEVDNKMRIAQEEIFGPVVAVIPHDGPDDAVRIANDSPYGLHGAVFTADEETALRVARQVRTGTFSVNNFVYNIEAPFGGVKASGVGRDTGREGYESFLELKTVNITPSMERFFTSPEPTGEVAV